MKHKKELVVMATYFSVIVVHLCKMVMDEVLCRYVPYYERQTILVQAHGGVMIGYFAGRVVMQKIL